MVIGLTTVFFVLLTIYLAYLTTQISMFGLLVADSWSDLSGAFTAAAALFTGLALGGGVATLRGQSFLWLRGCERRIFSAGWTRSVR